MRKKSEKSIEKAQRRARTEVIHRLVVTLPTNWEDLAVKAARASSEYRFQTSGKRDIHTTDPNLNWQIAEEIQLGALMAHEYGREGNFSRRSAIRERIREAHRDGQIANRARKHLLEAKRKFRGPRS